MPDGSFHIEDKAVASISPIEPTLADVLVALKADSSLSKSKREAWGCSVRRVAIYLERDTAQLLARLQALRFGISRLHHAQLGVSRKTLQNHIANLRAAVRHFSGIKQLSGRGVSMSSDWQVLYDKLPEKRLRLGLSGFLRYCSATGIEPVRVVDTTVDDFITYTSEYQFTVKPKDIHKQVPRSWNRARESVADWPQITLREPDFRAKPASLPLDAYPKSFQQDLERYLALLSGDNLLDEDAPDRPCKPSTINARQSYLLSAANAAVNEGVATDTLTSLADLVKPDVVKLILEHYIDQHNGEIRTFTIDLAERLRSVARRYVKVQEDEIQILDRYCRKLGRHRRNGLTPKNMAVIRAYKSPQNRKLLKALPGELFDKALAEKDALTQAAVNAQIALAIQILLLAPMRIANLAALNLEESVVRVGGKDPAYHLVIPGEDVKNDEPLEYPLAPVANEMLGLYLGVFRPRLCRVESSWLFPGEAELHKNKGVLSEQIINRITREIGVRATPHQFRHLAAAFILEKDPANYEFVRRILGHKNLETTIRFYVGLETIEAVRQFSAIVLEEDE
jgi:integrase